MFTIRKTAAVILPLLVLAWVVVIVPGESAHSAGKEISAQEAAAKSGAGLCAATAVAMLSAAAGRARRPVLLRRPFQRIYRSRARRPQAYRKPPPPGVPILKLLQIIRA